MINQMMNKLTYFLNSFDVKGRVWLGLWSAVTIGLCVYCTLKQQDLPTNVMTTYAGVLAAYTYNRTKNDTLGAKDVEKHVG